MDGRRPVTLSPMRAAIARRLAQSKRDAPRFYDRSSGERTISLASPTRNLYSPILPRARRSRPRPGRTHP